MVIFNDALFIFPGIFFFLVSLRTNKRSNPGFYCASSLLHWLLWTHYYALIPLALLFAYALFWGISRGRENIKQFYPYVISFITFLIISLPYYQCQSYFPSKGLVFPPVWGTKGLDVIYEVFSALSEYHRFMMALFFVLFIIGTIFFLESL